MKIRFLFHKPIGERGVGKLIVGYTWLLGLFYNWKVLKYNYSHEEAWFTDNFGNFAGTSTLMKRGSINELDWDTTKTTYLGECFSSTTRGNAEGVRFAPAREVLKHPERWDYIEIEVDAERFEVAYDEAKRLDGLKYDYGYILDFLQPFTMFQKEKRWACSEICDWLKFLCRVPTHYKKTALPLPAKTDWFKFTADQLKAYGLLCKRHKRISPRRAARLLAKIYGEPRPLI